jgi:hypothetical protein
MSSGLLCLPCIMLALTGGALIGGQSLKEKNRMQQELSVDLHVQVASDHLEFEYSFENSLSHPVLVFDRLWDMQANALKPNWAYVEIRDGKAAVKRLMETLPQGLHLDSPAVPYGREIAPHARSGGKFSIALPLKELGAYDGFVRRGAQLKPVAMQEVTFSLGWCPKPASLPPAIHPVEMNGETLWLLPFGLVSQVQRIAVSAPVQVHVTGEAFY